MILSYEDGNSLHDKRNFYKQTNWAKFIYTKCAVFLFAVMIFTKGCLGSFQGTTSPLGPKYKYNYYADSNYIQSIKTQNQCLYVGKNFIKDICENIKETKNRERTTRLYGVSLKFCNTYTLHHLIPQNKMYEIEGENCSLILRDLKEKDYNAYQQYCVFLDLLKRSDCDTEYSVNWNCGQCREMYKNWLCSVNIPVYSDVTGEQIEPCNDFCKAVEYSCPYLRPFIPQNGTYAGERSFICKDRVIDQMPSLSEQCYKQCYLTDRNNTNCVLNTSGQITTVSNLNSTTNNSCWSVSHRRLPFVWICVYILSVLLVRTVLLFISIGLT